MKKLALVLGGGGAKGIAHVGVLKVLEENGIKPNLIVGTSMGAIVGGLYASGLSIDEMIKLTQKLSNKSVTDFSLFSLNSGSIFRGKKIEKMIRKTLGEITHKELKTPFVAIATEIATGKQHNLSSGLVWKNVMASSAIPAVYPPVEIDGKFLSDGCIMDNLPVDVAKAIEPDSIILSIDVVGDYAEQVENGKIKILSQILNMSTLYMSQLVANSKIKADLNIKINQPEISQINYNKDATDKAIINGENAMKEKIEKLKEMIKL